MDFFSHNSIRKYTIALLDEFNDIYIERLDRNSAKQYINVPITFGSKDKAFTLNQKELDQWLQGNYNVLPRMSLSLLTMQRDSKRDTNRLHTINSIVNGETITFQYNAVSYIFTYELAIATRSMSELSVVLEQILPQFNPSLRLIIKEIDLHEDPTSIPVGLMSVDLDLPNNIQSDDDIRIVGATLMLELKGNIYQPFRDENAIKMVRLYSTPYYSDEELQLRRRSYKYQFGIDDITKMQKEGSAFSEDFDQENTIALNPPNYWYKVDINGNKILDSKGLPIIEQGLVNISGPTSVLTQTQSTYMLNFIDKDDEDYFIYIWNILSGDAGIVSNNQNPVTIAFGSVGTVIIQGQIIDRQGNASELITTTVVVS